MNADAASDRELTGSWFWFQGYVRATDDEAAPEISRLLRAALGDRDHKHLAVWWRAPGDPEDETT